MHLNFYEIMVLKECMRKMLEPAIGYYNSGTCQRFAVQLVNKACDVGRCQVGLEKWGELRLCSSPTHFKLAAL